jgi:phage replication-related protein YjqB (UPF0714/DUF867 family)
MEMNFGDWELKKWDEIPESSMDDRFCYLCLTELSLKITRSSYQFLTIEKSKPIIVVAAHSGVIRYFVQTNNTLKMLLTVN